ncbi:reverse transcriptase domain-containing protein [Glycomyces xiaoerkulensis]|uniref:reverse transcriptase domain-containing protein n=1 Tax=Glycomyces xiaoerkulensis TaxID=2038139 RepID=UPI0018E4BA41|nr:reverse transcriptase domain-containing protein [Glycomyces xiaoerkulensis]
MRGKTARRLWVLDADLSAAFDRIGHDRLMAAVGQFPGRDMIRGWLKAGVMEEGRWSPTEEGTPQGGVISPLLLNIALHGMEQAAGVTYQPGPGDRPKLARDTPALVRYADDFAVFAHTKHEAEAVKQRLAAWLEPRGLRFNEDKTRIVHLDEEFDFLGFNIRRYERGRCFIKPSREAVGEARARLREEFRLLRGTNAEAVLIRIAPIVRGWATYYRHAVAKKVFADLDQHLWKLACTWAKRTHPRKSKTWVYRRYFGQFNKTRQDKWVFGDPNTGAYLPKFAWTPIIRHTIVRGPFSPDDPALRDYWDRRRRTTPLPVMNNANARLAFQQKGLCPLCGQTLIVGAEFQPQFAREWIEWFKTASRMVNRHHLTYQRDSGGDELTNLQLVHGDCHRQHHAAEDKATGRKRKTPKDSA